VSRHPALGLHPLARRLPRRTGLSAVLAIRRGTTAGGHRCFSLALDAIWRSRLGLDAAHKQNVDDVLIHIKTDDAAFTAQVDLFVYICGAGGGGAWKGDAAQSRWVSLPGPQLAQQPKYFCSVATLLEPGNGLAQLDEPCSGLVHSRGLGLPAQDLAVGQLHVAGDNRLKEMLL
jgi:hypothetical protein